MEDGKDAITVGDYTPEEKQVLADLEAKHGRIYAFRVKDHALFALRKPLRAEWRRRRNEKNNPAVDQALAEDNFAKNLVVLPADGGASFERMLDDFPNMIEPIMQIVEGLATGTANEIKILGKDWKTPAATT